MGRKGWGGKERGRGRNEGVGIKACGGEGGICAIGFREWTPLYRNTD